MIVRDHCTNPTGLTISCDYGLTPLEPEHMFEEILAMLNTESSPRPDASYGSFEREPPTHTFTGFESVRSETRYLT